MNCVCNSFKYMESFKNIGSHTQIYLIDIYSKTFYFSIESLSEVIVKFFFTPYILKDKKKNKEAHSSLTSSKENHSIDDKRVGND
jgi:hypothetical protein